MSASLIAALLGLLCISLIGKTQSLHVFQESKELYNIGAKSRARADDSASANARIVNGSIATMNKYPWMVALNISGHICGGSIISNQFILTAAHCVQVEKEKNVIASLGDHILNNGSETKSQNYQIEEIISHEDFSPDLQFSSTPILNLEDFKLFNDIALLRVNGIIEYNENVSPICLSKSEDEHIGEIATVAGWGTTENGLGSDILKEAQVRVISNSKCIQKKSLSLVSSTFHYPILCAEVVNGDAGVGDSGGPLFIKKNNKWEQIGIVCCGDIANSFGIYTRVSDFLKWIESKTGPIDQSNC